MALSALGLAAIASVSVSPGAFGADAKSSAPSTHATNDWTMYGQSVTRQGYNTADQTISPFTAPTLKKAWVYKKRQCHLRAACGC